MIICGMAGARRRWAEAADFAPPGIGEAQRVKTLDPRLQVFILPGMKPRSPAGLSGCAPGRS